VNANHLGHHAEQEWLPDLQYQGTRHSSDNGNQNDLQ
jgi:hypothetical protein